MGTDYDHDRYSPERVEVEIPPPKPLLTAVKSSMKETFFPDDPFRAFKNQPASKKAVMGLQYFFTILDWAPRYKLSYLKSDIIAGITISSLAVPQGISYASLGGVPPIVGIYGSFVPPLVYAILGSSRDIAIGPVAVASLLLNSILSEEVSPTQDPKLYFQMALTACLFSGILQAGLGFLRLGFVVDLLSHATILGFMGGAATTVILQQLKGLLGIKHFTQKADVISVLTSVFNHFHEWEWEPAAMGFGFLLVLFLTKFISKKRPSLFWVSALAPLFCVVVGSLLVFLTHADEHNIKVIGPLKKGMNPVTVSDIGKIFKSRHLAVSAKAGLISGIIGLAEGVAVGRSFATVKNYHIDGNKEMIAFGMMNIIGSCVSCFLSAGPFSRTAVNFNAGCKTQVSNIVMAIMMLLTLLFLTPLFQHTPLVVLSSIIVMAMFGLIDIPAIIHLWKIDKIDCMICMGAYLGVIFGSVEIGLSIAVVVSLLRLILFITRPRTLNLGKIPNTSVYRSVDQYPTANNIPGVLILQIDSPIYFANSNYLRERISRWIFEEEDRIKASGETSLQYLILDISTVGGIDTSGISMLEEVKRNLDRRNLKLVLANPRSEVIKKLDNAKFIETVGLEWMFVTVEDAVEACKFQLQSTKHNPGEENAKTPEDNV
ncbi:PREDICTED: sulfate transporter 3.1-like [Fragaria vesca subsp. vesca]|uniref:sulfate transporter 3.1-like n=1 Tax=Fragaria vesca subsp. vesca TaxID=101020 RepID=UPI0002C2FB18|nr:PREDICTED: sulfate transporter 3.1-like [Fragaria vesca subsp. vesca]XP_011462544.1 PREDICTED: sulfate transporter 3.1-like [Fragaria vesca subsp. vesca]